jgi:hypothetical protein
VLATDGTAAPSQACFTITNAIDPADGNRYIGDVPDPTKSGVQNGGVNGGTLRIEGVPGIIIRAVALGTQGAFGTSNQVNVFAPPASCAPEPDVNLAFIDLNAGVTNHLSVLNNSDQTVVFQSNVPRYWRASLTSAGVKIGLISNSACEIYQARCQVVPGEFIVGSNDRKSSQYDDS